MDTRRHQTTGGIKKDAPGQSVRKRLRRTAAAYSPNWWVSTIGVHGLNFSVRNGKRWFPAAIATAIFNLREIQKKKIFFSYASFL